MKEFNGEELAAALRIFNYANKISGNYQQDRLFNNVEKVISYRRWIVFPYRGIYSIQEAKHYPLPNIYFSFYDTDEIADDGNGRADCYIGITYHNELAMKAFREILKSSKAKNGRLSGANFMALLQEIDISWDIRIDQKIKIIFPKREPDYETFHKFKPRNVSVRGLLKTLDLSDNLLPVIYKGYDVINAMTIINISKQTTIDTFDSDLNDMLNIFKKL